MARQQRILVADDDDMVRSVMRTLLAFGGYHVEEAVDGLDAVRIFSQSPGEIDLVMMDLNMPALRGDEALLQLQRLNPRVKAVLLTGGVETPHHASGPDLVRYLQKPFLNEELVQIVREMLPHDSRSQAPRPG